MKKFTAFLIILFSISGFSKTLIIEGNYKGLSGKGFKKEWKVNVKENRAEFFLDGKLKATMYVENGKIVKIEEIKRFAGKDRLFALTKPQHIQLELKSQFYPFSLVYNYFYRDKSTKSKENGVTFKILEVKK